MKRTINVVSATGAAFLALALTSCHLLFEPTATASGGGGTSSALHFQFPPAYIWEIGEVTGIAEVRLTGLAHANASDLEISLVSPGGRSVHLLNNQGGPNEFVGGSYVFVDDGDDDGLPHLVTYLGDVVPETYQAYGDLGDFEGGDARGNWYLDVRNVGGSEVSLGSWELTLHYKEYE